MRKQKGLRLEVRFQDKGQGGRKGKISAFLPLKNPALDLCQTQKTTGGGWGGCGGVPHVPTWAAPAPGWKDGPGVPATGSVSPAPRKSQIDAEQGRHNIYRGVLTICPS